MLSLDTAVRLMGTGLVVDEIETDELLAFAYADAVEAIELLAGE
jgi:hypothetical protein